MNHANAQSQVVSCHNVSENRVPTTIEELSATVTMLRKELTLCRQQIAVLEESEEHYRILFDHANDGMLCLTPGGIVADVNQCYLDVTGRERENVLGRHYSAITSPASAVDTEERLRHAGAGEPVSAVSERELVSRDGSVLLVEVRTSLIRGPKGEPLWVLAILRDITERKRMEAQLRESEARYRRLFDNAYDGMVCFTRAGIFTRVNTEFANLLGRSRHELIGQHYSLFTTSASAALHEERQRRYRAGEKLPPSYELEVIHKSGARVWLEGRTKPVPVTNGQPREILGIYRDITERKRAEATSS